MLYNWFINAIAPTSNAVPIIATLYAMQHSLVNNYSIMYAC